MAFRFVMVLCGVSLPHLVLSMTALWEDQTAEFIDRCVPAPGFPQELRGSLFFAGPSLFSLGEQKVGHGFDGLGRIHKVFYDAASAQLCHSARFIESPGNAGVLEKCDLTTAGNFGAVHGGAWWSKIPLTALVMSNLDNTWVNQQPFGQEGRMELMTDSSSIVIMDGRTLKVDGVMPWNDTVVKTKLPAPPLSTAHPVKHPETEELYNVLVDPGILSNDVVVFKRSPAAPEERREVARIPIGSNMLMQHSWALAKDYVLVIAHPMFLDHSKVFNAVALLDFMQEQPTKQNYTKVFVVPLKGSGAAVREYRIQPFMNVHAVNAYEEGRSLIFDLEGRDMDSDGSSFYSMFTMDLVKDRDAGLRHFQENFKSRRYGLHRFEIRLDATSEEMAPDSKRLAPEALIFPVISPKTRGSKHCFIWAANGRNFYDGGVEVLKLHLCDNEGPTRWRLPGYTMVAEAQFVPSKDSAAEDAGWLVAPLHDEKNSRGAYAVVDAASMATITVVPLMEGDVFNWCAHSTWVEDDSLNKNPKEQILNTMQDAVRRCAAGSGKSAEL